MEEVPAPKTCLKNSIQNYLSRLLGFFQINLSKLLSDLTYRLYKNNSTIIAKYIFKKKRAVR